jgi:hypothetical protein
MSAQFTVPLPTATGLAEPAGKLSIVLALGGLLNAN